jgi:hypothetical protein
MRVCAMRGKGALVWFVVWIDVSRYVYIHIHVPVHVYVMHVYVYVRWMN